MIEEIALVECGFLKKITEPTHSVKAYKGILFDLAHLYAQETSDHTYILSPEHGALDLFDPVYPYPRSSLDMLAANRDGYGDSVIDTVQMHHPCIHLNMVFYSSDQMANPVIEAATHYKSYWSWSKPLHGLSLSERIQWFLDRSTSLKSSGRAV